MKRRALRSMAVSRSTCGAPATWLRRPSVAYSGMARMPERPSRKACATSSGALPRQDTIPIPVTTTRRIRSEPRHGGEQADAQVLGGVDVAAVHEHAPVADHHREFLSQHALDVYHVADLARARQHLAEETHRAHAQRAAAPRLPEPGEEEADQLPHGIQAEAARHHRVVAEMAAEEPEVRADVQFGLDPTAAITAALRINVHHPIHHQHAGQRQAGIARAE